jgi:PAS domain S-box-containing protein
MKFPGSFRQSLTLHFIVVAVLPILVLGFLGAQYFKNKHLETISRLLDAHALDVSHEATEFLQYTAASLTLIEKTINSGMLDGDEEINRYLQMAVDESGSFESIFLLDEHSRVSHFGLAGLGSNRTDYLGLDYSAHDIFAHKDQLSGNVWSDTFLSAVTAEPSVTLGIPLETGTLLGTVSLQKLSGELIERLEKTSASFNFSLLDHHGVLIADSRPGVTALRLNLRMHPEVRNALDHNVEVAHKVHEDNTLLESVRLVPETGWAAYASLPIAEALQGVAPLRYLMLTSLAFSAALGIALSIWLSRRLLRPVLLLRDAAGEVAKGNYRQIVRPAPYEELEELSGSFREMISAVEERERSISENRTRYRNLVNSIEGIVWELELAEYRFTFVSDQAEHLLGYPTQRWIDEKNFWLEHVHEEDREWVFPFCKKETEAQRDHDFEYRMIAADERVVWLKNIVSVIIEEDVPVRLRGVMFDITKRKEAESVLQDTTERLQLLINRMPFGCITWDAEHKVELWNPAAERIFGFSSDEVIGLHPNEFLIPEQVVKETDEVFARLERGDSLAHNINENLTKDGRTIICEWHNTPVQNSAGVTENIISLVDNITQRVSSEEALKESESRFRTVFQTNPDAVLIVSLSDERIVSVNEHCLTLSGFTREEMIEKTTLELGVWADVAEREKYHALIATQGYVENFEMSLRIKDGRIRVGLASARTLVLNDEDCVLIVIRDITAMKEAETRLIRSESRFRSLISAMGEGLIILGYNGEIVHCNQAAERILMMKSDDIVGGLHDELLHDAIREDGTLYEPDQHPSVLTLNTGEAVNNQIMGIKQPEGQIVWLQVNTHHLGLDREGKPVAVVVSFADVTGLKRVETELRSNEKNLQTLSQQFKGVLEAIPDQIMVLDQELSLVWLNHRVGMGLAGQVESAGIPCYQMPDVLCGSASGNDSPLCDKCPVKQSLKSGKAEEVQTALTDGRTLSLRAVPVSNEMGEVINVVGIVQDITEALRHQAQSMRTGQLAALGELAAGVAHEINNPINGVINYAQLILNKTVADSREQELSQRIIRESERIATIVRELLYFAREETQEVDKVTVVAALDEALALTRNQLNKEGIILQVQLPENLPEIMSRSHQIQQLFLNLISNARYALTDKYPVTDLNKILSVRAEEFPRDDQSFVRISFRDHGVGIDAAFLPRVLNPFTTTKPAGEGTGLGLSISHEIVQKHGGTMSIDSVHGEFTEVVIDLPAVKA